MGNAQQNKQQENTVKDAVCPVCFKHLTGPSMVREGDDRHYGKMRTYFGWCFDCHSGCEVIQFKRDNDRWAIYKYRTYTVDEQNNHLPTSQWEILNNLPAPAPVMTGPGGDYDNPYSPETVELMHKMMSTMKAAQTTLASLLTIALKSAKGKN